MKRLAAALLAGLILIGGVSALAAGGTSSDPMISQSYISGTYIPGVVKQAGERIDTVTAKTYESAATRLKAQADLYLARAGAISGGGGYAVTFAEQRFKRGDVISIDTGSEIMLLAGSAALSYGAGTVVDVTAGTTVASAVALVPQHRYLAAENTLCRVTVTSDTAVLAPQGYFTLTASGEPDYNQLATALKAMGVFSGTDTSYGGGYDLEKTPTRVEGLIMFLRLIGEEKAALAYTGENPFVDAPDWCKSYVGYAYAKGYTAGVNVELKQFGTFNTITVEEYLTFLLRALGYRDSGTGPDFTWNTATVRAQELGCITAGEKTLLSGTPFLRAQVAYLSYYSLAANRKAGGTLQSYLIANGALNLNQVKAAMNAVTMKRVA